METLPETETETPEELEARLEALYPLVVPKEELSVLDDEGNVIGLLMYDPIDGILTW